MRGSRDVSLGIQELRIGAASSHLRLIDFAAFRLMSALILLPKLMPSTQRYTPPRATPEAQATDKV